MTDLRALLDAATPGPWAIRPRGPEVEFTGSVADADLAVAAVNALPALLDVAELARQQHHWNARGHDPAFDHGHPVPVPAGRWCGLCAAISECQMCGALDRLEEVTRD